MKLNIFTYVLHFITLTASVALDMKHVIKKNLYDNDYQLLHTLITHVYKKI